MYCILCKLVYQTFSFNVNIIGLFCVLTTLYSITLFVAYYLYLVFDQEKVLEKTGIHIYFIRDPFSFFVPVFCCGGSHVNLILH